MKLVRNLTLVIIFISLVFITACSSNNTDENNVVVNETDENVEVNEVLTPEELGKRIGDHYVELFIELNSLLDERLDPEELEPKVAALKEKYIDIFVGFGAIKEEYSEEGKAKVNRAIMSFFSDMDKSYSESYNESIEYYRELDNELASLLVSFNILTQYADYELLIKQEPEEAERLGITE